MLQSLFMKVQVSFAVFFQDKKKMQQNPIFNQTKKRYLYSNLKMFSSLFSAVLGSEYCSGYMDALGKWNTGFYCPNSDESSDVFCCGTEIHKYCCTKKDKVIQSEVQE